MLKKNIMKNIILPLILLISNVCLSQSIWKKQADLRKENGIKETTIYQQNPKNSEQKRIWDWELYDRNGRLIESKRFQPNGKVKNHYKFEYPTDKKRVLVILNKRGKEKERIKQRFDLSNDKKTLISESENGIFGYEYDDNGNTTKVWRIKENPKQLQTEIFYDENNLRIKENLRINKRDGSSYISKRIYERDEEGNILKILTYGEDNSIESIEIHEHRKH
jgi:uncharacterized protein YxeA